MFLVSRLHKQALINLDRHTYALSTVNLLFFCTGMLKFKQALGVETSNWLIID